MKFKIGDLFLILIALAITIGGFIYIYFPRHYDSSYVARVEFNNEIVMDIDFNNLTEEIRNNDLIVKIEYDIFKQEKEYTVRGKISEVVICANRNGVYVKASGCPDHVCIKTGIINTPGRPIACIPNKIIISVIDPEGALG